MQCKMQSKVAQASVSGRQVAAMPIRAARRPSRSATTVVRAEAEKKNGVLVKSSQHVAVGGLENPGSPDVTANIDSGGRLPGGKKKTVRLGINASFFTGEYLEVGRILPNWHLAGDYHWRLFRPRLAHCQGPSEDGRLECHLRW